MSEKTLSDEKINPNAFISHFKEEDVKTYISNYILPKLKRIKELKEEIERWNNPEWDMKVETLGVTRLIARQDLNDIRNELKAKLQEQEKDIDDFKKQFGEELMPKEELK